MSYDSEQAYCACREVKYKPIENEDGTISDSWKCVICDRLFVKKTTHIECDVQRELGFSCCDLLRSLHQVQTGETISFEELVELLKKRIK